MMRLCIRIDIRERALLDECRTLLDLNLFSSNIQLVSEVLPIGDIILSTIKQQDAEVGDNAENGAEVGAEEVEWAIIERKTQDDLMASIKDGRYEEQSHRLQSLSIPNHHCIYLIEGLSCTPSNTLSHNELQSQSHSKPRWHKPHKPAVSRVPSSKIMARLAPTLAPTSTPAPTPASTPTPAPTTPTPAPASTPSPSEYNPVLYSAMTSVMFNKGFSLMRSTCCKETAYIICNMADKLIRDNQKGRVPYYTTLHVPDAAYISVTKRIKKENITPDTIGVHMLCAIPGVSSVNAQFLIQTFGTIGSLITSIQSDPHCLDRLQIPCVTKGKQATRKISRAVVAQLVAMLVAHTTTHMK